LPHSPTGETEEEINPTKIYILLAKNNLVHSIDDFLNLTVGQTELLLHFLQEYYKEVQDQLPPEIAP